MPLTRQQAQQHIDQRRASLVNRPYPHRVRWPSRLFHHSPIENAVQILQQGVLRARADHHLHICRDVAGDGVIHARFDAHQFVRFYFRPRTPTQFHIEGFRRADECEFGHQAPVLVMLVFHALGILSGEETRFSDRNMQRGDARTGNSLEFIQSIPWDKVYHEGGLQGDISIIHHRCAEVLAT